MANAEGGDVFVAGIRPQQGSKFDFVGIQLEGVTGPRTVTVCPEPVGTCPGVFFFRGFNPNGDTFDAVYVLISGNVTVSQINAERVRGTFQGTGVLIDPATGGLPDFNRTITITNGQFDAPVMNNFDVIHDYQGRQRFSFQ